MIDSKLDLSCPHEDYTLKREYCNYWKPHLYQIWYIWEGIQFHSKSPIKDELGLKNGSLRKLRSETVNYSLILNTTAAFQN